MSPRHQPDPGLLDDLAFNRDLPPVHRLHEPHVSILQPRIDRAPIRPWNRLRESSRNLAARQEPAQLDHGLPLLTGKFLTSQAPKHFGQNNSGVNSPKRTPPNFPGVERSPWI